MSCSLRSVGSYNTLEVQQWFQLNKNDGNLPEFDSNWGDWKAETENSAPQESREREIFWLNDCIVAVSPATDLLAFAFNDRIMVYSNPIGNEDDDEAAFIVAWKRYLGHTDRDRITALLCLPIASQKRSSSGGPDWSCVIVGFESGHISIYSENGLLLFTQLFEISPVVKISCRTFVDRVTSYGYFGDFTEELTILYENSIVTINGFSLLQMLKACRNQAAKAAASGEEFSYVPPLDHKKWSLDEQQKTNDCVSAGCFSPVIYDQLFHVSNTNGFNYGLSIGVPNISQLITAGRSPFIGVLEVRDVKYQPYVSEIALHYASKLKSALVSTASGWLRRNKETDDPTKMKPKIIDAKAIEFRHTIRDERRVGVTIALCGARRLAAVTDDFGRISLVDVPKGHVVRLWKGYRDAECGFVEVDGDYGDKRRTVPFFVIHAPRRSIVEIWLPQQGPRVAAFNVPKGARLLYVPHTLLGSGASRNVSCDVLSVLVLYPDGTINALKIPFHLALSGLKSCHARDVHLLKVLKSSLKNESEENTLKLLSEIATPGVKLQAVNLFKTSPHLTLSLAEGLLDLFRPTTVTAADAETGEEELLLEQRIRQWGKQLAFYKTLSKLHLDDDVGDGDDLPLYLSEEDASKKLSRHLMISLDETKALFPPPPPPPAKDPKKAVSFEREDEGVSLNQFLKAWESMDSGPATERKPKWYRFSLVKAKSEEDNTLLRNFLFGWSYSLKKMESFSEAIYDSGFNASELMTLLWDWWRSQEKAPYTLALQFYSFVLVTSIFATKPIAGEEPKLYFWGSVRGVIYTWTSPWHAHFASVVCRAVEEALAGRLQCVDDEDASSQYCPLRTSNDLLNQLFSSDNTSSINEWERLTREMVEWSLILRELDHLLPMQKLLTIFSQKSDILDANLSLQAFDDKGKGYPSELIAKWLAKCQVDLKLIENILPEPTEEDKNEIKKPEKNDDNLKPTELDEEDDSFPRPIPSLFNVDPASTWECNFKDAFAAAKTYLPHALDRDVLFVNWAWELGAHWNRNPYELSHFGKSIEIMEKLSNKWYRHGLGSMMWEMWLYERIRSICEAMEKTGRLPKDQLSIKGIATEDFSFKSFFFHVRDILKYIVEGTVVCEHQPPPPENIDDSFYRRRQSGSSLADLCVLRKMSSYDLSFLHFQLLTALYLAASSQFKNVRPISLFSERERLSFFKPLSTVWEFGAMDAREVVNSVQMQFLVKVVTAAVVALPDLDAHVQGSHGTPAEVNEAIELGRSWGVSVDAVRRHYVCSLYNSGLDSMAEGALCMVRDNVVLGSQLIVVAGQRLQYMVSWSPLGTARVLALTSPFITDWIKSLESMALRNPNVPVAKTIAMVTLAVNYLPKSSAEYKTGVYLHRSLEAIMESQLR